MYVKDKEYLVKMFGEISLSVTNVNEKIAAHKKGKLSAQDLQIAVALEQLAIEHKMLVVLATLVLDPAINEPPPELPKNIVGFK